ncbi:effector binding domain-containing protein [Bacillus sp. IITD106]|nr:effector binding domain-containing protein [Bacillus sp. IITD106]
MRLIYFHYNLFTPIFFNSYIFPINVTYNLLNYTLCVAVEGKGESSIVIPDDTKYETFKVDTNDEQGIFNTWNDIWKKEDEGQLKRAYTYDFEKYYPDGNIDIFIAVKEK